MTNLTSQQIRDIFSGTDTNWSQVGGASLPISVFERTAGSGTRLTFDKDMMGCVERDRQPGPGDQHHPGRGAEHVHHAWGDRLPVPTRRYREQRPGGGVHRWQSTEPANVSGGKYPFFSHEHCFTKPQPSLLALSFLQYIRGATFQAGEAALGYLPLATTTRLAAVDQ